MSALIAFWSHALAASMFVALLIWRLGEAVAPAGPAAAACGVRADGVLVMAVRGATGDPLVGSAESARNLVWIGTALQPLGGERRAAAWASWSTARWPRPSACSSFGFARPRPAVSGAIVQTSLILRITMAAGALVWSTTSTARPPRRAERTFASAMLGLAWMWGYDLISTRRPTSAPRLRTGLDEWRGLAGRLTAPLFAFGARSDEGWDPAVARGDIPVALAARDLRLLRADGDRRDRTQRVGS